jgi:hypothetical protein
LDRRTRNRLCIWIIGLGLLNLVAYTVSYAYLQGDARNGEIREGRYYVRGHFLHGTQGKQREVDKPTWIYSYIHSISIWPSEGLVVICLLILARPVSGQTFVTICVTLVGLLVIVSTFWFLLDFLGELGVRGMIPLMVIIVAGLAALGTYGMVRWRKPGRLRRVP